MNARMSGIPIVVFQDANSQEWRCINGLHVQTFIPNPFGAGTLLTFANGDSVTLVEDFDLIVDALMADRHDG